MNAAMRSLVAIPIGATLVWAGAVASDAGRAKALLLAAATEMRTWASTGNQPDPATWASVRERIEASGRINSKDPTQRELLGLLGSMRTDRPDLVLASTTHLASALQLRPGSAYTWAYLAEAIYRLGDPGSALETALQRAVELGPSEPGVQRLVADYGLAVWNEITPVTQSVVDRMVTAGMRRNSLEMLQISERRGRLDTACRHLAGAPRTAGPRHSRLCPWEITP